MLEGKSIHTKKWDRCVKKVKSKSPGANAYAICSSSIEDAGVKKEHQKKTGKQYYSNWKKSNKNEMLTTFESFLQGSVEEKCYDCGESKVVNSDGLCSKCRRMEMD